MKKILVIIAMLLSLYCTPASAQIFFLYGDSPDRVAIQFLPVHPHVTKDTLGFVYFSYVFSDLTIVFQFLNDKLMGVAIMKTQPVQEKAVPKSVPPPRGLR
jgi:hypothetical protein